MHFSLWRMREIAIAEIRNIGSTFDFWAALTEIEYSRSVSDVDIVCLCICVKVT
jgi:hypothetical protein